jgi:NADPH2:quinone reductase
MLWNNYALKFFLVYELKPAERPAVIAELTQLLDSGVLKHSIGPRFPLKDIAAAHDAVEGGKVVGNVVLDVG